MRRHFLACLIIAAAAAPLAAAEDQTSAFGRPAREATSARGEALYGQHCAMCHDHAHDRIPLRIVIERKSPEGVVAALTTGPMRPMASGLSNDEIKDIAVYLTGKKLGSEPSPSANLCPGGTRPQPGPADWASWGVDEHNTLFQSKPGLTAADVPKLKLKWAFAYPGGTAAAEPIAVGGRLFLSTPSGLFALDAKTGCTHWHSGAAAGAKMVTAAINPAGQGRLELFFGDGKANVGAIDAGTGKLIWSSKVDDHPSGRITGPVTIWHDRIYAPVSSMEDPLSHDPSYPCCTFRGSVVSLDIATGKEVWKSHSISAAPQPLPKKSPTGARLYDPAGGAIYAPLTIDEKRHVVYAATAESYHHDATDGDDAIIAFDLDTGARKWVRQPKPTDNGTACKNQDEEDACDNPASPLFEFAAPPVLVTLTDGKDVLLVGQKSGVIYALDPDREGKLLWETRLGQGGSMGGVEMGFAAANGIAYVPISDSEVKPPHVPGGMAAVDAATGKILWRTPSPTPACRWGGYECNHAQAGSPAAIPGIVFSGSWDGHMRAYATKDGAIVWDVDTAKTYSAVNGVKAEGGAISGYPVIVSGGMVYVTSGAASMTHPGNALLAFSVEGR
ncbi:MAG TPA: PQQ-binding-like beta-propeller repeat protein [Alphaproteobacteria bacterium]|nr:PQQ-binding-like beta-propeller repeat protein [Alphaproteobacteria bacterium]